MSLFAFGFVVLKAKNTMGFANLEVESKREMSFMPSEKVLPREFFERDPEVVAKELLGKRLVRMFEDGFVEAIIVETEAYYGLNDPASRAFRGIKNYNKPMFGEPGITFVYNVHKYWMLNIVSHEPNKIGAVLIRAVEPTKGIERINRWNTLKTEFDLTNGPGKLSKALMIDKRLNAVNVTSGVAAISIYENKIAFEIGSSFRIGVRKDLDRKLRFFIKENKFVSK